MKKLLGILIILCSCSSGKEYNEPQFVEKEEIRGECLSDDLMISYAYDMAVDDQYIYTSWHHHKGNGCMYTTRAMGNTGEAMF